MALMQLTEQLKLRTGKPLEVRELFRRPTSQSPVIAGPRGLWSP